VIFIDDVDMKLLAFLWYNADISFNKLGTMLNISGNVLKKRAEILQEEKIFSYSSIPNFSMLECKFGQVVFVVNIPKYHRSFYIEKFSKIPNIFEIIFTLEDIAIIFALLPLDLNNNISNNIIQNFINDLQEQISEIYVKEYYKIKINLVSESIKFKIAKIKFFKL